MAGQKGRSGGGLSKSLEQHKQDGTLRPDRHGGHRNPHDTTGEPEPPVPLTDREMVEWERMTGYLRQMGILYIVDAYEIALFAQSWVLAQQVKSELAALETLSYVTTQMDSAGNERVDLKVTPLLSKYDQLTTKIERFLKSLGCTPDSRFHIKVPLQEEKPEDDIFAKLQKKMLEGRKLKAVT